MRLFSDIVLGVIWAALAPAVSAAVKVFVLAGQSNMEGQAVVDLEGKDYNGGRGTLVDVLKRPEVSRQFGHVRGSDGQWVVRGDVRVRYRREQGSILSGPLGVGYSVYGDAHHFGPELAFGHVVGDALAEPVLLIKTAWGGKSLRTDFRPPSAGGPGPYYARMLQEIREGLESVKGMFPGEEGWELAGFVWYQGWNDGVDPERAVPEYESNLVHLIGDVRRDLGVPGLPVVVGELTGPWVKAPDEWERLRRAQRAASERPLFAGNVEFVETRDFVRAASESPNPGHGHHEFGNAETYLRVGDALGRAMMRLVGARPRGYRTHRVQGWTVQVHEGLLGQGGAEVEAMLPMLRGQLADIVRVVPAAAVARLREVPIWCSPRYPGRGAGAEYHPDAGWLRTNGRNPAMAKSVEISDVGGFARETDRMPWFVLHELAHAYHDRVLGFEREDVRKAFEQARKSGVYERVERHYGNGRKNTFERAYAMTDPKEYFAEQTEAYFGRNDFFPFTREELLGVDPGMHALVGRLWGVP